MNFFTSFLCRNATPQCTGQRAIHSLALTRRFVETHDERCPIAGIWSRLDTTSATTDEPEITRPTTGMLFSWWALHVRVISVM
jgi:hypothetical protein